MRLVKTIIAAVVLLLFFGVVASAKVEVDPYQKYTFEMMEKDIYKLEEKYPKIVDAEKIGRSEFGRALWTVRLGRSQNGPSVFINGSHHAREWISTNIIMKMLAKYAKLYEEGKSFGGYVPEILDKVNIYFVPMVNPDGVELQQRGLDAFPEEHHSRLIELNNGSTNFDRWKADALGIDPNRQYPSRWENIEYVPGRTINNTILRSPSMPSYAHYKGDRPFQTVETQAVRDFTYEIEPEMALSYHSTGQVIFYPSHSPHQYIAEDLRKLMGYRLVPLDPNSQTAGGYTDWFVEEFNRPAYTPELAPHVGSTNPPVSDIPEAWERNRYVGLYSAEEALNLWEQRGNDRENIETIDKKIILEGELTELAKEKDESSFEALSDIDIAEVLDDKEKLWLTEDDRLMVPVRQFSEFLGYEVIWDNGDIIFKGSSSKGRLNLDKGMLSINDRHYSSIVTKIKPPGETYMHGVVLNVLKEHKN